MNNSFDDEFNSDKEESVDDHFKTTTDALRIKRIAQKLTGYFLIAEFEDVDGTVTYNGEFVSIDSMAFLMYVDTYITAIKVKTAEQMNLLNNNIPSSSENANDGVLAPQTKINKGTLQ